MVWLLLVLVPAVAVLYYWLFGSPLQGKGSPYGRVGVIPRKIADSLTDFDERPAFRPPAAGDAERPGIDLLPVPAPVGAEWVGLIQSMAARIQAAIRSGFTVETEEYGVVLHRGESARPVPLAQALEPPPTEPIDRAVRACLVMLEEAQAFRANELDARWPVRVSPPGEERTTTSRPIPRAVYADGAIHPGYHDDLGVVLELDPIIWPQPSDADPCRR